MEEELGIGMPVYENTSLRDRVHRGVQALKPRPRPHPQPHTDPSAGPRTSDMFPSKLTLSQSDGSKALRGRGFRDNDGLPYTHEQEGEGKSPGLVLGLGMSFEAQVSMQRRRLTCYSLSSASSKESVPSVGVLPSPAQDRESKPLICHCLVHVVCGCPILTRIWRIFSSTVTSW